MSLPNYEESLVEFLRHPGNIRYVFEIGERLEAVKDALQIKFWRTYKTQVEVLLKATLGVRVTMSPESDLVKPWAKLDVLPTEATSYASLVFTTEQSSRSGEYVLYYGIRWSRRVPRFREVAMAVPEVGKVRAELERRSTRRVGSPTEWWLGWVDAGQSLRGKEASIRLSQSDAIEGEIASEFLRFVEAMLTPMREANAALAVAVAEGRSPFLPQGPELPEE